MAAWIVRNIEDQVKAKLKITSGFKIVFKVKNFEILMWVYDRNKKRINRVPIVFAKVDKFGRIIAKDSLELELFLLEVHSESDVSPFELPRLQLLHTLFETVGHAYRQFGTLPPSLNGLD